MQWERWQNGKTDTKRMSEMGECKQLPPDLNDCGLFYFKPLLHFDVCVCAFEQVLHAHKISCTQPDYMSEEAIKVFSSSALNCSHGALHREHSPNTPAAE